MAQNCACALFNYRPGITPLPEVSILNNKIENPQQSFCVTD